MIKKITWQKREVLKHKLDIFLNYYNFQPGKFLIVEHESNPHIVYVIAVKSEDRLSDIKETK